MEHIFAVSALISHARSNSLPVSMTFLETRARARARARARPSASTVHVLPLSVTVTYTDTLTEGGRGESGSTCTVHILP